MEEKLDYLLKKLDECLKCYKLKYYEKEDLKIAIYPYLVDELLVNLDFYMKTKDNLDNYVFICIKNRINKELSKIIKKKSVYTSLNENTNLYPFHHDNKRNLMLDYLIDRTSPRNVRVFEMMLVENMSFSQISKLTGLSESRIRQIINSSIIILKRKWWYFE